MALWPVVGRGVRRSAITLRSGLALAPVGALLVPGSGTGSRRGFSWGDVGSTFLGAVFAGLVLQAPGVADGLALLLVAVPLLAECPICVLRGTADGRPAGVPGRSGCTSTSACSRPAGRTVRGRPVYLVDKTALIRCGGCWRVACGWVAAAAVVLAWVWRSNRTLRCRFPRRFSRRIGDGDGR